MPAIPFIKKKIGQSYLVWFQNSNQYLQLEEPVWFIFMKTIKRYKSETIAKEFSVRYGISSDENLAFVKDIRREIDKMNQADEVKDKKNEFLADLSELTFVPYSVHRYRLGNKLIAFSFQTRLFEHYLHPLICHFETTDENEDVTHNKTDADWLMTVHASAITNRKKTILFSAPPNHGKTTIAALLQDRGYKLISDDFVPIESNSFMAYPFPIAMSVKQSSMDLLASIFPALEQKPLNYISPEKSVRFLPPNDQADFANNVFPVQEFIFINYNKEVDFCWEKLDPLKAVKLLLDQAWITPTKGNAKLLFDRILQTSFYQLTYSNNQKALEAITNLFDHD